MAEEVKAEAADASTAGKNEGGAPPPAAAPATGEQEPWRNTAEIKKYMIRQRELEAKVEKMESDKAQAATAAPKAEAKQDDSGAQALAMVAELKRDLALERALNEAKVDGAHRELIELAVRASNPADVREFVKKFAPAPVASPPEQKAIAHATDSGAPSIDAAKAAGGPKSPAALTPAAIANMSIEELDAHYKGYVSEKGSGANPFAAKAKNGAGPNLTSILTQAIAAAQQQRKD